MITRGTEILPADMTALAAIANAKTTLAGTPYDFSSGGWRTEINRLRQNIFLTEAANNPDNILSGPWILQAAGAQRAEFGFVFGGTDPLNPIVTRPIYYGSLGYLFPSSTVPTGTLTLRMETEWSVCVEWPSGFPTASATYKLNIVAPVSGDLRGTLRTFARRTSGVGPTTYTITGASASYVSGVTVNEDDFGGLVLDIEIDSTIVAPNDCVGIFEIRVNITSGNATFQDLASIFPLFNPAVGTANIEWTHVFSGAAEIPGIHPTKSIYSLGGVDGTFAILPYPLNIRIPGSYTGTNGEIFKGNQAFIDATPSSDIIGTGVFSVKSRVINQANFGNYEPNDQLNSPTLAKFTKTVSPGRAIIYHIPRFPTQNQTFKPTITDIPSSGLDIRPTRGTTIVEIYLRRPAVNQGGVYLQPTVRPAITATFGCIRGGVFTAFSDGAITIPVDASEIRVYRSWPMFETTTNPATPAARCDKKLIFQCDTNVDCQAVAMDPNPDIYAGSAAIGFPILAAHYNDTESMLALIT